MKISLTILLMMIAVWSTAQVTGLSKKIRQLGTQISNVNCNCEPQRDSLAKLINKGLVNLDALSAPAPAEYERAIDNLLVTVDKLKGQSDSIQRRGLSLIILDLRLKFEITADNMSAENSFDLVEVEVIAQKNLVPVHSLCIIPHSGILLTINSPNTPFAT